MGSACSLIGSPDILESLREARLTSEKIAPTAQETIGRFETIQTNYDDPTLDALLLDWDIRFAKSKEITQQFAVDIRNVKLAAAKYLKDQQKLSAQIADPTRRRAAKVQDYQDFLLYQEWAVAAEESLQAAQSLVSTFNDIDLELQKMQLRKGYAFRNVDFNEINLEVEHMRSELLEFRDASDKLAASTSSPFAQES